MARVTVEDCVVKIPNRFELVLLAAQRAREITSGAPLSLDRDDDKNPVVALREIADETIGLPQLRESVVRGMQKHVEIDEPEETHELEVDPSVFGVALPSDGLRADREEGLAAQGFEDADIEDADIEEEAGSEEDEAGSEEAADQALDQSFADEDEEIAEDDLAIDDLAVDEEEEADLGDIPEDDVPGDADEEL